MNILYLVTGSIVVGAVLGALFACVLKWRLGSNQPAPEAGVPPAIDENLELGIAITTKFIKERREILQSLGLLRDGKLAVIGASGRFQPEVLAGAAAKFLEDERPNLGRDDIAEFARQIIFEYGPLRQMQLYPFITVMQQCSAIGLEVGEAVERQLRPKAPAAAHV